MRRHIHNFPTYLTVLELFGIESQTQRILHVLREVCGEVRPDICTFMGMYIYIYTRVWVFLWMYA